MSLHIISRFARKFWSETSLTQVGLAVLVVWEGLVDAAGLAVALEGQVVQMAVQGVVVVLVVLCLPQLLKQFASYLVLYV